MPADPLSPVKSATIVLLALAALATVVVLSNNARLGVCLACCELAALAYARAARLGAAATSAVLGSCAADLFLQDRAPARVDRA
jgi:hypothetical protein